MPTVQINGEINVSVQPGDALYAAVVINNQSGSNHPNQSNTSTKPQMIGVVDDNGIDYANNSITFTSASSAASFGGGGNVYLFASKDNRVNTSGMLGYFAEVEFVNHSTKAAEIFVVAADYVPSSK
jgi:hypothetical protein